MDIQKYLTDRDKTQSWLAEKAGISKQLLSLHIKNPSMGWRKHHAEKIVTALFGEPIREKIIELVLGE